MKGRGVPLAIASLVLAASVALPALSVAQEPANPGDPPAADQTSTSPAPPEQPAPPAQGGGSSSENPGGEPASTPSTSDGKISGTQKGKLEPTAGKAASKTVSMEDFFFSPKNVTVGVGDSVTWVNHGQEPHSAAANDGSFDTGVFNGGGRRSVTFSNAGSFAYICTVHPNMTGTVRVTSSGGGGGSGGGSGSEAAAVSSSGAGASGSSLASTGTNLPAVFAAGLALLVCGVVLRRRAPSA
ncbi:MAG: hypothetical protein EXQ70_06550 [Solirubrobacterales bacterium]|nr:hypothetical protein [Solirubrobacterales bacterium]